MSRFLKRDEVSWSALTESVLTFHYVPVPIGRAVMLYALYEMSSYNFLQIYNFVISFTTFASLHIVPFTSYLPPGILCTSTEDTDAPSEKQSVGGHGTHMYSC